MHLAIFISIFPCWGDELEVVESVCWALISLADVAAVEVVAVEVAAVGVVALEVVVAFFQE